MKSKVYSTKNHGSRVTERLGCGHYVVVQCTPPKTRALVEKWCAVAAAFLLIIKSSFTWNISKNGSSYNVHFCTVCVSACLKKCLNVSVEKRFTDNVITIYAEHQKSFCSAYFYGSGDFLGSTGTRATYAKAKSTTTKQLPSPTNLWNMVILKMHFTLSWARNSHKTKIVWQLCKAMRPLSNV